MARVLTGLTVLMVAAFAAVVSYSHIYDLARLHGESGTAARLLPLSVDGLILAASLVLLHEARAHRAAPGLARFGLALGVLATVGANVMFGVRYGITGALISAWPAVAFVLSTEIMVGQVRRAGDVPTREAVAETVAASVPADVPGIEPVTVPSAVPGDVPVNVSANVSASGVHPAPARRAQTVTAGRARGRAPKRGSRTPERVFAAEVEAGTLPSLREVKRQMRCGTTRARKHLAALQDALDKQEVRDAA